MGLFSQSKAKSYKDDHFINQKIIHYTKIHTHTVTKKKKGRKVKQKKLEKRSYTKEVENKFLKRQELKDMKGR